MSESEFSVCQFFHNGNYEYVRRFVGAKEAVETSKVYTESLAARTGLVTRVIITDGGDNTVFEWQYGNGITYPTPEMLASHDDT